ncbi:hypothetical protein D9M69_515250 [compost metagenome]
MKRPARTRSRKASGAGLAYDAPPTTLAHAPRMGSTLATLALLGGDELVRFALPAETRIHPNQMAVAKTDFSSDKLKAEVELCDQS